MKLYCHNTNTRALLFYCKQGFSPCGYKVLVKPDGEKLVGIAMQKSYDPNETETAMISYEEIPPGVNADHR